MEHICDESPIQPKDLQREKERPMHVNIGYNNGEHLHTVSDAHRDRQGPGAGEFPGERQVKNELNTGGRAERHTTELGAIHIPTREQYIYHPEQ